jgi:hypothetical protein
MSGSIFGNVAQVQVPDFQATQARAQELAMRRRQMDQQNALTEFFQQNGQGFSSPDAAKRMNLLAMLAQQGGQGAAMALPMLGQERQRAELRAIMNDEPIGGAPAAPVVQPAPMAGAAPGGGGGFSAAGLATNTRSESGGDPNARPLFPDGTPRSSSTGPNQFIDGTWLAFANANPNLFQGMSRQQILDARRDANLSAQATQWYAGRNAPALRAAGVPVNDATLGLAHQFDGPVAARIATAPPNTPIADIVGPAAMRANPDLVGQTAGQVVHRFQQRYAGGASGDTIPVQNRPPGAAQPDNNDARIATLMRRAERLAAAGYQQEAQTTLALIQSMRRGEAEPLERVRRPDGTEVLVPRSRAAGMESAPAPRETPGPFGNEFRGRALQTIEELAPIVGAGTATPEQLRRYGSAVAAQQAVETRPDGSRVVNPLPSYAPGIDWVAQRYPGFVFDGATQPGAAPAQAPAQGAPATPAAMGDAAPAVPSLPPAGAPAPIPGAQGGVQRDGNAMEGGTRRQIEEQIVGNQDAISRLTGLQQSFRPEYQQWGTRWTNMWAGLRERSGAQLSAQETARLRNYTQARSAALENLNATIKETTGAAMSESEAARITATMPNPGTGLFDGDSPTEFQAKLDRAIEGTRRALIRRHYALSRGLNPTATGIELSEIPALVDRRGREIEAELRQGSPDADAAQVRQQVRARLRQEFGI